MEKSSNVKRKSRWGKAEANEESIEKDNLINKNESNINNDINLFNNDIFKLSKDVHLNLLKVTEVARIAIEKAKLVNEEINNRIQNYTFKAKPLKLDDKGREIDEQGNVINIKPLTFSTLKINRTDDILNLQEKKELKKKEVPLKKTYKWVDSRISCPINRKRKKVFNFIKPGSLIEQEQLIKKFNNKYIYDFDYIKMMQNKHIENIDDLSLHFFEQNENLINTNDKDIKKEEWKENEKYDILENWDNILFNKIEKKNINKYIKMNLIENNNNYITNDINYLYNTVINENEHLQKYNIYFLKNYEIVIDNNIFKFNIKKITKYIEHPIPLNDNAKDENVTTHMYLTQLERKKLRKRKRQEKEREKQDKIRIGLIPPPPPKVKLSNLINVYGTETSLYPSKMEMEARQQIKEREMRHYQQNQERKLTPQEKKRKKIKKWTCNPNEEIEVSIIFLNKLNNRKHIFKIDINAQQLHLTGVCFVSFFYNFIIVEGKHVSIERYKRLLFRRIKWNEDEENENEENEDENKNENENENEKYVYSMNDLNEENDITDIYDFKKVCNCNLLWNGKVKKKSFPHWKIINATSESEITDYLKQYNVLHYYHIVKKFKDINEGI